MMTGYGALYTVLWAKLVAAPTPAPATPPIAAQTAVIGPRKAFFPKNELLLPPVPMAKPVIAPAPPPMARPMSDERPRRGIPMEVISARWKVRSLLLVQVSESASTAFSLQLAELRPAFTWIFAPNGSA